MHPHKRTNSTTTQPFIWFMRRPEIHMSQNCDLLLGFFIFHFHFLSAHLHVIHQCNFLYDFTTQVFKRNLNKLSLSCSTFISAINQLDSIILFIIISSHTISLFSFIHLIFIYLEQNVKVKVYPVMLVLGLGPGLGLVSKTLTLSLKLR